jgi:hypothetical protein
MPELLDQFYCQESSAVNDATARELFYDMDLCENIVCRVRVQLFSFRRICSRVAAFSAPPSNSVASRGPVPRLGLPPCQVHLDRC